MPEKANFDKPSFGNAVGFRLSLAAKLYSIFALFAVLTAAITILSDYNTRRNAELTEAIETASRSALNVDGTRRREEVWRGAYQVQRSNPCRSKGLGVHRPGR